ncbi:unnamed protein product [marine sediment metagenome]|uniref:Uncharacterized protein n=1 Tax=marine sediment metagenome TaxID=412755 RepID=X1CPW0_9ZZZZ
MSDKEQLHKLVKSYVNAKKEVAKITEQVVEQYAKIRKETEEKLNRPH